MASTPKKRLNHDLLSPNTKSKRTINPRSHSSSSSTFLAEPPPNLFPSKSEFLRLVAILAIAASVAVVCNYASTFLNRQPKPFCDSDADFDYSLSDTCEPCPSNGMCYEGKLECTYGYRKHGKSCVEDGDINGKAKKLTELAEIYACAAYAQFLCKGTGAVWIKEDKLWNDLDEFSMLENHALDAPVYVIAKQKAAETVGKLLETRTNVLGVKELKCPDSLVEHYKPIVCYVRQWIAKHALILLPFCALLIGSTWLLLKVRRRYYLSTRAEQLYNQVCDVLEEQALISRSLNAGGEPWVVASWLRDHLLLPKERKDTTLWTKVGELVQEDSRLNQYPKLVKAETKVVWEWQVEGCLSSLRKRKKAEESQIKLSQGVNPPLEHQHEGSKAVEMPSS